MYVFYHSIQPHRHNRSSNKIGVDFSFNEECDPIVKNLVRQAFLAINFQDTGQLNMERVKTFFQFLGHIDVCRYDDNSDGSISPTEFYTMCVSVVHQYGPTAFSKVLKSYIDNQERHRLKMDSMVRAQAHRIDRISRVVLPCLYSLFVAIMSVSRFDIKQPAM